MRWPWLKKLEEPRPPHWCGCPDGSWIGVTHIKTLVTRADGSLVLREVCTERWRMRLIEIERVGAEVH